MTASAFRGRRISTFPTRQNLYPAGVTASSVPVSICRDMVSRTILLFFFSSRRRHTRSVLAFLLNRSSDLTLYFDSLTVNAGNGGFLHCIQMDTSVNAANQVVSVGADIAFDADPKFFACLVRFESSSVPTTLPTAYDVYPLDGRHDGGYY